MIKYHPDDNLLLEFSAGTLAFAQSIAVSSHLHFCDHCRRRVDKLTAVGANLMDECDAVAVSDDLLANVMANLEVMSGAKIAPARRLEKMPKVIDKLIGEKDSLRWQFLTPSLDMARLQTGQKEFEVALHRIKAGGSVAEHDHGGTEITLVLDGSFSDEKGIYHEGDFLVREAGETHRPLASRDAPCICLSVVAARVRMTGTFTRWLNPFLAFKPQ